MSDTEAPVHKRTSRALAVALALAITTAACANSDPSTVIHVEVGQHFSSIDDGLRPGDPLAGASVMLFRGDRVVFEAQLDANGNAAIHPEPGRYTVQVELESSAPGGFCSWGDTIQDVVFPQSKIVLEAGLRCAGG